MIPLFKVRMNEEKAIENVSGVLRSGYIGEGWWCRRFESCFGKNVVLVNSGTSAITLALDLIGVGPGDEVISTPMTCLATNEPILKMGAKVVWADIDPNTGIIDADDIRRQVTPRTKAVIGVSWGGRLPDVDIRSASGRIPIILDLCHVAPDPALAFSGERMFLVHSLQAIKHLTTGDGGLLVCGSKKDARRARLRRWFGLDRANGASMRCNQVVSEPGWKFQSNDIAAAIGMANLSGLSESLNKAAQNAAYYNQKFRGLQLVSVPPEPELGHDYWLYTLLVSDPADFIGWMGSRGVECSQVHARNDTQPIFAESRAILPGVDLFSARQVNIPVGWWVTESDRARVASLVREWDEVRSGTCVRSEAHARPEGEGLS